MTATITLDGDDQSTVRRMLIYLYTLDYDDGDASPAVAEAISQNTDGLVPDPTAKPDVADDEMATHCKRMNNIRVYALAGKYNIQALKELAKAKFKNGMTSRPISHFSEVINAILVSSPETDSGLRDVLISTATSVKNLESILKEGALSSAIRDDSSFGLGVLRAVIRKLFSELEKQKQGAKKVAW